MNETIESSLTQLGAKTPLPASPNDAVLETFKNPVNLVPYVIRFTCPEFTSLCPKTGQPDFAHIVIDYIPVVRCVESKSLKLFLHSFRNHGAFHEECTGIIFTALSATLTPAWIRVAAYWYPRGGIPIDVFYEYGSIPKGVHAPALDVPMYRGRG